MNPLCWLTRRRLGAYHDQELAPAVAARVEAHLGRCPGCSGESAAIQRLHVALAADVPELPAAAWNAFWPQVRTRLAAELVPEPLWRRAWAEVAPRRLVFGSALAGAALAVVAVLAPWQQFENHPRPVAPVPGVPSQQVVVQSVEATDPQSSVMVYTNPESDVTVVWVFGLERTEI